MIKKKLTQAKKEKTLKAISIEAFLKRRRFLLKGLSKKVKVSPKYEVKEVDEEAEREKEVTEMRSNTIELAEEFKLKKRIVKNLKKRKLLRGLKILKLYKYKGLRKTHFTQRITIKITPNNIFCLIKNLKKNKTEYVTSGGRLGLNITKKKIKFLWKTVITDLFEHMQNMELKNYIFSYSGPRRLKKKILRLFKKTFRPRYKKGSRISKEKTPKQELLPNESSQRVLLVTVNPKKVFNGCRVKKKKRKKRGGFFRVFK